MRYTFLAAFATLAASAALLHAQDERHTLRLRWLPGYRYVQETVTENTTGLTALGQAEDQKMKVRQTTQIDVQPVPGGGKEARVVFRSIQGEMQMQGKKLQFDSANPEAGDALLRQALGPSVGAAFILIYNDKDEFTGVRDTGALAPAPDGNPSLAGIAQAQEVAELYRRSLEMGLPKSSVKVGDRWSSEEAVKFPSAGTVTVQLRAKLDAVVDYDERRHAKISFEGDMKSADAGVARVTLADGSKSFGQVLFDLERGTISFAAFRADIILDIDGQKLPVRQQVTTKLAEFVPLQ